MINKFKLLVIAILAMMLASCVLGGGSDGSSATVTPQGDNKTLVSMQITPGNATTYMGIKQQFTATGTYSDGSIADLTTSVTWVSSNTSAAYFGDTAGLAIPAGIGATTITATDPATLILATATLNVSDAVITSLTISPESPTTYLGFDESFAATGTFSDGKTKDITLSVSWSSDNTGVATIESTGVATPVESGTTNIIALDPSANITASTVLTVSRATLKKVAIDEVNPTIHLGFTESFTATGTFSNGESKDITRFVSWSSTDIGQYDDVASIVQNTGVATPEHTGQATIAAVDPVSNLSDSTVLTVESGLLMSIAITPVNPTTYMGFTENFTATGTFSDGTTQDLTKSLYWSSNNTDVATINAFTGVATSVGLGNTDITATSPDGITTKTTLYVKNSVHFLGESQFAKSQPAGSVSAAIDPLDETHYVAYINNSDNHAYYAKYSNESWVSFKIGGDNAPAAKPGSIVSIAITESIENGYGHVWVAYETSNGGIFIASDSGLLYSSLAGSSPSLAYDSSEGHMCVAYRDSSTKRVELKSLILSRGASYIVDYSIPSIVDKDGGNSSNNIHLAFHVTKFSKGSAIPFIVFDDGNHKSQPRVKFYSTSANEWNDICGNGVSAKSNFVSDDSAGETAFTFDDSGSNVTVAYIKSGTHNLYVSTCMTSSKGGGSNWKRSDTSIPNQSGISIASGPNNYLYVSSNNNGKLALKVCPGGTLSTCDYYTGTSSDQGPSIAGTPYATSLTLDANGLPAVAYLDVDYFISMVAGTAKYQ